MVYEQRRIIFVARNIYGTGKQFKNKINLKVQYLIEYYIITINFVNKIMYKYFHY